MKVTTQQVEGYLQTCRAVADAIRELKTVPSGHLYAQLMGYMDLDTYNQVIGVLKTAKLIKEENHLLIWLDRKS